MHFFYAIESLNNRVILQVAQPTMSLSLLWSAHLYWALPHLALFFRSFFVLFCSSSVYGEKREGRGEEKGGGRNSLCCALPRFAFLCHAMLRYAIRHAILCYVVLCYALLHHTNVHTRVHPKVKKKKKNRLLEKMELKNNKKKKIDIAKRNCAFPF